MSTSLRRISARFIVTWLFMALFALPHLAHATPPRMVTKTDLRPAADAYSRAAGLPALGAHPGFELRVWSRDFMGGSVTGTIVANGQLRILNTSSTYEDGKVIVKPAPLGMPTPVAHVRRLETLVARLETRNGMKVTCPMFDGGSILVNQRPVIRLPVVTSAFRSSLQVKNPYI